MMKFLNKVCIFLGGLVLLAILFGLVGMLFAPNHEKVSQNDTVEVPAQVIHQPVQQVQQPYNPREIRPRVRAGLEVMRTRGPVCSQAATLIEDSIITNGEKHFNTQQRLEYAVNMGCM